MVWTSPIFSVKAKRSFFWIEVSNEGMNEVFTPDELVLCPRREGRITVVKVMPEEVEGGFTTTGTLVHHAATCGGRFELDAVETEPGDVLFR